MTAMAMSCRPDLIIFDEPTTALDVTTQIEVLAAIRDIVEQFDTAAIYITHDLAVVAQMADRIKVLRAATRSRRPRPARCSPTPKRGLHPDLWAVRSFARPKQPSPAKAPCPLVERAGRLGGLRHGQGAGERQLRHPPPAHRRRRGRKRLGQVDHRPRDHRPPAARRRRGAVRRALPCRRLPQAHQGPAPPGPDDLPDGRHRAEPEGKTHPRDHRPARAAFYSASPANAEKRMRELLA
jgi:ABC-type glutathione transport system ATPase component